MISWFSSHSGKCEIFQYCHFFLLTVITTNTTIFFSWLVSQFPYLLPTFWFLAHLFQTSPLHFPYFSIHNQYAPIPLASNLRGVPHFALHLVTLTCLQILTMLHESLPTSIDSVIVEDAIISCMVSSKGLLPSLLSFCLHLIQSLCSQQTELLQIWIRQYYSKL